MIFHFTNFFGRKVWIWLIDVMCVYEGFLPEEPQGVYVIGCTSSSWTVSKAVAERLVEKLEEFYRKNLHSSHDDGDWWKNGGPNPLDSDEEN